MRTAARIFAWTAATAAGWLLLIGCKRGAIT